jgi:uncharacterized membrane protein YesL
MEKYCRAGQATGDAYGAYGAYALHAGYLKLQKHTLAVCITYCLSTVTVVAQTRFSVTLICTLPVLLLFSENSGFHCGDPVMPSTYRSFRRTSGL